MTTYMIVIDDPDPDLWKTVQDEWPDRHLLLTERLAFIAPEDLTLTRDVADKMGFNSTDRVMGLIVQMDHRAGFHESRFIEWLEKIA